MRIKYSTFLKHIFMLVFMTSIFLRSIFSFAYTNSFADWYGLGYIQPSPMAQEFIKNSGHELSFFDSVAVFYSFESNANPRNPFLLSNGFTLKSTVLNYLPFSELRYGAIGGSYDISAKLIETIIGGMKRGIVFGLSGKIGAELETVSLLVGSSSNFADFTTNDFRHYNSVSNVNLIGSLGLFAQLPIDLRNFPDMLLFVSYNIGISLFGPFTPDLQYIEGDYERTFTNIELGLAVRYKF